MTADNTGILEYTGQSHRTANVIRTLVSNGQTRIAQLALMTNN